MCVCVCGGGGGGGGRLGILATDIFKSAPRSIREIVNQFECKTLCNTRLCKGLDCKAPTRLQVQRKSVVTATVVKSSCPNLNCFCLWIFMLVLICVIIVEYGD